VLTLCALKITFLSETATYMEMNLSFHGHKMNILLKAFEALVTYQVTVSAVLMTNFSIVYYKGNIVLSW
jgi:hypothetical protein